MNIAEWLDALGLERYVAAFQDNDVDALTLPMLTEADLAAIGVRSVGHRRKLVGAIAALNESRRSALEPASRTAQLHAEHRQLTVLYCEMVGPGMLSARAHDEDLREALQSFHKTCTKIVADYDGHVANFYGDCVLGYFGWPRAHEDDAERAVRVGLTLIQLVNGSNAMGGSLLARVGIATGPVVVGDLIREGPAREQSAVGVTPNLGARMLGLARPGQVVIDELTHRLLARCFVVQPLGRHALKGMDQSTPAYAISGELLADSRFDAHKGRDLAPMIGRDQELALLLERWERARGAEGQAVLLVGEAGIGKSRLIRSVLDACAAQPASTVRWQCSPYHAGSALWPVVQRLGHSAGLGANDSHEAALDKLEALVGSENEATALYATLLGFNGTQRYGPLEMTPLMLRERTLELLVEQLFELAEQRPLLLVVEDAHWIDPTTLELIGRCLEKIESARIFILITSRPNKQPELGAHPNVGRLSLNRLSRASVEAIVTQLGGQGLQAHTLATIVTQTDGVPLFVEELTKAVLETGEAAIPASLHGSLMARLDRIPEVKEVAQIAACIGREFDQALLQAVAEEPEKVGTAMDKLTAAELVFRRGDRANPKFTFKHALVQEAAYESLLRGRRQAIHARILEVLDTQPAQTPPEILAHHAHHAKQADKAICYWQKAGDLALAQSAYVEAMRYFENALNLLGAITGGVDRADRELTLQYLLGRAQMAALGFGSKLTRETFGRAHALLPAARNTTLGVPVAHGLWVSHSSRGECLQALHLAEELLAAAQAESDETSSFIAQRMLGATHLILGHLTEAQTHLEAALSRADTQRHNGMALQLGVAPEVAAQCFLAWTLFLRGKPDTAMDRVRQVAASGSVGTVLDAAAYARYHVALLALLLRDRVSCREQAGALAELAERYHLRMWSGYARSCLAWSSLEDGNGAEAVEGFKLGMAELSSAGAELVIPFFQSGLAMALAACGRQGEARAAIDHAIHTSEQSARRWCLAELWRVDGELVLRDQQRDRVDATRSFERALSLARSQGAKLWELRAAVSLARQQADEGQRTKALALLAPIYEGFTEGFNTVDLKGARALLDELAEKLGHDN